MVDIDLRVAGGAGFFGSLSVAHFYIKNVGDDFGALFLARRTAARRVLHDVRVAFEAHGLGLGVRTKVHEDSVGEAVHGTLAAGTELRFF